MTDIIIGYIAKCTYLDCQSLAGHPISFTIFDFVNNNLCLKETALYGNNLPVDDFINKKNGEIEKMKLIDMYEFIADNDWDFKFTVSNLFKQIV